MKIDKIKTINNNVPVMNEEKLEKHKIKYKQCIRCIMDTSDSGIFFDIDGMCNHCKRFDELLPVRVFNGEEAKIRLEKLVAKIKSAGRGRDYDCIIGISGGVDSTYVAYITKSLGLRPLAVHFDNGWNSELAVKNIQNTLDVLNIDLYTHVVDWESFKDLQFSFLKSSTPDGEVPTDHAISGLLFSEASKRGIKYIISGMNFATESISIPSWAYGHSDIKYISAVHKAFGTMTLKRYPSFSFGKLFWWTFVKRIQIVSILNYMDYSKDEAMSILNNELGWIYYGGKHYESVYTRFYQGYVLPKKFGIDKRRAHLSDLILSKQISREQAIDLMNLPAYDEKLFIQDYGFVLKKFNLKEEEFEEIMNSPKRNFREFPNHFAYVVFLKNFINYLRSKGLYSK